MDDMTVGVWRAGGHGHQVNHFWFGPNTLSTKEEMEPRGAVGQRSQNRVARSHVEIELSS